MSESGWDRREPRNSCPSPRMRTQFQDLSMEEYCKIDRVWVLLFLLTALAWAQPAGAPKPVFPDDSQDPKLAGGAEFLEAVCPGHVVVGKDVECKIACPEFTAFKSDEFEWSVTGIIRGHFQSLTSDDAVLSMSGCEPHSLNFGGTILLTKQSGRWTMLWYKGEFRPQIAIA